MARWLVVGAAGMLGTDLVSTVQRAGHDVTAWDLPDIDITDSQQVMNQVRGFDVVANTAAWTAVDAAEEKEAQAFQVNAVGPQNLARACAASNATLVHVSTDYVFDGAATQPYTEDAPLAPRSAYGRTKAAGEWAVAANVAKHYIVRTAYLYGAHGPNLVKTFLRLAEERDTITAVTDQYIQPTWVVDLADGIVRLVDNNAPYGAWHGTGSGQTTVRGLAQAIFSGIGLDPERVGPTTLGAYPSPTPRPSYSVLSHQRWFDAGIAPLPDWQESLVNYLEVAATSAAR